MLNELNFLSEFIDDLPIGIGTVDLNNKLPNSYNKFFLDMFGWSAEEIDTLDNWFIKAYPNADYREEVRSKWTNLVKDIEEKELSFSHAVEVNITCKDGSIKICEYRWYRKENFSYAIMVDITDRKNMENKLELISLTDHLTKLNNKKSYNDNIKKIISQYQRYKTPFSVIMYDIDNFKYINDTYGHSVGDDVLIEMSQLISSHIRKNDYIFRVGGEEFIILLTETQITNAKLVAEKIRSNVEKNLKTIQDKQITISIGLTEVNNEDTKESIYKRVDKLLYESKNNGRNTISYDT